MKIHDYEVTITARHGQQRARCPVCEGRNTTLSVNLDKRVFKCFRCDWHGHIDGDSEQPDPPVSDPETEQRERIKRRDKLTQAWRSARPLTDASPALAYLRYRGLGDLVEAGDLPHDIRLHPNLSYWDTSGDRPRYIGAWPALLAVIRTPAGEPASLHRTYIATDGNGKAPVIEPKKMMSASRSLKGSAIRLYPAGEVIGLAEGIETALALRLTHPDLPVWSCVFAQGLRHVALPETIREVVIAADNDRSGTGQRVARALSARLAREGRRSCIIQTDGWDSDYLNHVNEQQGRAA